MLRLLNSLFRRSPAIAEPQAGPAQPPAGNAWGVLRSGVGAPARPAAGQPATALAPTPPVQSGAPAPPPPAPAPLPLLVAAPAIVAPAKLPKMIIWGNCQADVIAMTLKRIPALTSRWNIVQHGTFPDGETLKGYLADFEDCNLLVLQEIRDWKKHPLRDNLPAGMRVVRYPFLYFAALWPFDAWVNSSSDPNWKFERGLREFGFPECMLARLRTEITDPEARFASYRRLDMPDCVDIARYAELESARLLQLDRKLETTIGRHIVESYQTTRLFHASTHPTADVMLRLINEILANLEVQGARFDDTLPDYLGFTQVPIHPLVIERLGLTWATPESRYRFNEQESLTFEEYARRYISVYG